MFNRRPIKALGYNKGFLKGNFGDTGGEFICLPCYGFTGPYPSSEQHVNISNHHALRVSLISLERDRPPVRRQPSLSRHFDLVTQQTNTTVLIKQQLYLKGLNKY